MSDRSAVESARAALVDPKAVCAALGLARGARRQAKGLTISCPLHKEKSPSCSVTVGGDGTLRFHCFGCGAAGDVLTLIAAVRGLDIKTRFADVIKEAAALAGLDTSAPCSREPDANIECISPQSYNAIAQALLDLCPLDSDPDVLAYACRRVLLVEAGRARLGALPPPNAQRSIIAKLCEMFSAEALARAGLLWQDESTGTIKRSAFVASQNRLLIPWCNLDGTISALQRRRLDDQKAQKYVFPRGIKPVLPFGAEQLRASDAERVIVFVEGGLDVLALRLLDRRDHLSILPLGLPGLSGWRSEWARFTKGRAVRIGFDADAAAEKAIQSVASDLAGAGAVLVERWTPKAKDWCAVVERQVGAQKERA